MQTAIQQLLANLGASMQSKYSCPDCHVLKYRLALQKKANGFLKGKHQEATASLRANRVQLRDLRNHAETRKRAKLSQSASSSGHDASVCRSSPALDLLGGTIPISIIEGFPAASSFNTDPPSADSPPDLGKSEDDQSSESEAESVNYVSSTKPSWLPVISNQDKLSVSGAGLPGEGESHDLADGSFSSNELPYVRYFSGAIISSTSTISEIEHARKLASLTGPTSPVLGPVSVLAGPRVSTISKGGSSDLILSGDIRWALDDTDNRKKRLFATEAERETAIAINRRSAGREDLMFPDLFRYGIRYNPEPTVQNVYRTILMEGLSCTTTLKKVLKKVRGGSVQSIKLCDTYTITGSCSALITFLSESAACEYKDFAALHTIYVSGTAVKVSVLDTPTWPLTIPLKKAIFHHLHTRCLEVRNLPCHIDLCVLRLDLRVCPSMDCDMIEYLGVREDDVVEIRFSSVNAAGQAFGLLTSRGKYRPCSVRFSPDPCALPLETLLEQGESDLSEDSGTLSDVLEEQFADDEGVGEDEDDLNRLERFSSSEFENGGSEPVLSQAQCNNTLGTSLLD